MAVSNLRATFFVSFTAGLIGGVLVTFLVWSNSAKAQSNPSDIPQSISAQEFRLIDRDGKTRAMLAFSNDRQPYLQLSDESDTYRVWMGISTETGLAVRDVDGKTRLVLSVDGQGVPSLVVRDRQHRSKAFYP